MVKFINVNETTFAAICAKYVGKLSVSETAIAIVQNDSMGWQFMPKSLKRRETQHESNVRQVKQRINSMLKNIQDAYHAAYLGRCGKSSEKRLQEAETFFNWMTFAEEPTKQRDDVNVKSARVGLAYLDAMKEIQALEAKNKVKTEDADTETEANTETEVNV